MGLGNEYDDVHHATATGTLERVDVEDAPPCGCGIKERPTATTPLPGAGTNDATNNLALLFRPVPWSRRIPQHEGPSGPERDDRDLPLLPFTMQPKILPQGCG